MNPPNPFRAEPKHWADIQEWVEANSNASTDHCLWELKQRVETLEARITLLQPPTLKEQALEQLNAIQGLLDRKGLRSDAILQALKSL